MSYAPPPNAAPPQYAAPPGLNPGPAAFPSGQYQQPQPYAGQPPQPQPQSQPYAPTQQPMPQYTAPPGMNPSQPQYAPPPQTYAPMPQTQPMQPMQPYPQQPYSQQPYPQTAAYPPQVAPYPPQMSGYPAGPVPAQPQAIAIPAGAPGTQVDLRVNGAEVMVLNPPAAYSVPALDPRISTKFQFQNSSLAHSEKNYTAANGVSPEEIKAFFIANSNAPAYCLKVNLYHWETRRVKDANGNEREEKNRVNDYSYTFHPDRWIEAPGAMNGLDDAISNFLKSSKQLRKCTLEKHVNFDVGAFTNEIREIVRQRGWLEQVECFAEYLDNSQMVTVHGDSGCHDVCDSSACKFLLCISCLCLCWAPMKACCFEDSTIAKQDLRITITPHQYAHLVQKELPPNFVGKEIGIEVKRFENEMKY